MCGRYVLGLKQDQICKACMYKQNESKTDTTTITPEWIDLMNGGEFEPNYNVCPGISCPVLILDKHLNKEENEENKEKLSKRVICTMKWGFVPSWNKGNVKIQIINTKSETVNEKPMFRSSVKHGKRCVVIANGFYEWLSKSSGTKQPYFIYNIENDFDNLENGKLLYMAGIFDIFNDKNTNKTLYTFSIITVDSKDSNIGWIHNRMPLILENEDEIEKWLDADKCSMNVAKSMFKASNQLKYHAVSKLVNFTGNNSSDNILELKELNTKQERKQTKIDSIFKRKMRLRSDSESKSSKKIKK